MTDIKFKSLVDAHDFLYDYSDDPSVYTHYSSNATIIFKYINTLEGEEKKEAINYYNSVVDKKIVADEAPRFKIK